VYKRHIIRDILELRKYTSILEKFKGNVSFDTETTGLHIMKDRPFLLTMSWFENSIALEIDLFPVALVQELFTALLSCKYVIGHNVKYDLHMEQNVGVIYEGENLTDTMIVARLSLDTDATRTLRLKTLAKMYLGAEAGDDEKLVKSALTSLKRERNLIFKKLLQDSGYTLGWFRDIRKDALFVPSDLGGFAESFIVFEKDYPEPNYLDVFNHGADMKEIMFDYAMNDTEITLDLFNKLFPVMVIREHMEVFERENKLILPLLRMERVGLKIDRPYIKESMMRTRNYIQGKRAKLYELMGEVITIGRHKTIKRWFSDTGVVLNSTDDRALKSVINRSKLEVRVNVPAKYDSIVEMIDKKLYYVIHIKDQWEQWLFVGSKSRDMYKFTQEVEYGIVPIPQKLKDVAQLIRDLRTLEKWYSAYIMRMLYKSEYDGRAYTQINQASAVTGRVSSDFQQFPKHALNDDDGNELVNPRKMMLVSGGQYKEIYYLDYSQIELRVQAHYTLMISGGDLNMCRAYMPFKCYRHTPYPKVGLGVDYYTGFNHENAEDLRTYADYKWFQNENDIPWHPVDLHSATTKLAFPDVKEGTPEFKELRNKGKSTNFAKNYGATTNALITQFGFDQATAEALDKGYYQAFPKILDYQNLIKRMHGLRGYVKNMYNRRYYLGDKRWVYKLYNYVVQGTCADMLKEKIIEADTFLKPHKSRFQMNIHDEMSFEIYVGEEHLIAGLKKIMEDVPWMRIPIIADVEVTTTNWADKVDVIL